MAWFKRSKENISPNTLKKELPDGLWEKCPSCNEIIHKKQLETNLWTCQKCNYHFRIGSYEYIKILLDEGSFKEINKKMRSADPLEFVDTKKYSSRINDTIKKLGLYDAIRTGTGKLNKKDVAFGCMDFKFIGGSMGSVVGEKIARLADTAYKNGENKFKISPFVRSKNSLHFNRYRSNYGWNNRKLCNAWRY